MTHTRVLLSRHAETAAPHLFHGAESDIGLSERGLRQAHAIAPILATERPFAVVSSAMRRAVLTAEPIAVACGVSLRQEPDLHERRVGGLSGQPFTKTDGIWRDTLNRWMSGETHYAPDGAESFDDIRRRVWPVWHRLADDYAGQTYVVIAHGAVIKVLLLSIGIGYGPEDWHAFHSPNLGINELIHDANGWRVERLQEVPSAVRETT
jgi:broad specificity phosphatase PhoE